MTRHSSVFDLSPSGQQLAGCLITRLLTSVLAQRDLSSQDQQLHPSISPNQAPEYVAPHFYYYYFNLISICDIDREEEPDALHPDSLESLHRSGTRLNCRSPATA